MSADERGVDVWDLSAAEEDEAYEDYEDVVQEVGGRERGRNGDTCPALVRAPSWTPGGGGVTGVLGFCCIIIA